MHDRDPGTAVVEQQVFEIPKHAFQHEPFDPLTGELRAAGIAGAAFMRGFQHHVAGIAERFEQAEKGVEKLLARDRRDERGQPRSRAGIAVAVEAVACLRHHIELPARADRLGERKAAVAAAGEVRLEGGPVRTGDHPLGGGRTAGALHGVDVVVEESHGRMRGRRGEEGRKGVGRQPSRSTLKPRTRFCAVRRSAWIRPWRRGSRCPAAPETA